jgi:mono/diheme cytochrome c family protein
MIRLFAIPLVTLSALSAALLISTPLLVGAVDAQEKAPGFQYRFRSAPIPAATPDEPKAAAFSSDAAKEYLDAGAMLWANQKQCVACHTHGIYMLARPALTPSWGEPPEDSRAFVAAQAEKIRQSGVQTGSSPVQMAYTARGLATWDSQLHGSTSPETDAALRYLFEMQGEDGSIRVKDRWPPLDSSTYHGTAMAAMAVAEAPGWRSTLDDAELVAKIDRLESYLRETPTENDHQGVLLLWASTRLPDLLTPSRRREL